MDVTGRPLVRVRIDRLVLDGVGSGRPAALVARAIEAKLARLLAEGGLPAGATVPVRLARVDAPDARPAAAGEAALGAAVADSLIRALDR